MLWQFVKAWHVLRGQACVPSTQHWALDLWCRRRLFQMLWDASMDYQCIVNGLMSRPLMNTEHLMTLICLIVSISSFSFHILAHFSKGTVWISKSWSEAITADRRFPTARNWKYDVRWQRGGWHRLKQSPFELQKRPAFGLCLNLFWWHFQYSVALS